MGLKMITRVIKRDGRKVVFSERRIRTAVGHAMNDAGESTYGVIQTITDTIVNAIHVKFDGTIPTVEQIEETIVLVLKEMKLDSVAECFNNYRDNRTLIRETKSDVMKAINKIGAETVRDNANVGNNFSAKLLQIASIANKWANLAKMPKEHAKFHESRDGHIHDLDSFNLTLNCLQADLKRLFKEGFNTGYGTINPPKRIESAADLACIVLQAAQNDMFGG
jgi:ribonucleoside-triphosphate reductase